VASSPETLGPPAVAFAKDGDLIVIWSDDYLENGTHRNLLMRKIPRN
jgi:hypothetical protein